MTLSRPVEVDETYYSYMGGKCAKVSNARNKERTGRGAVSKTGLVGVIDCASNKVVVKVVESTDKETPRDFVKGYADHWPTAHTDDASASEALPFDR